MIVLALLLGPAEAAEPAAVLARLDEIAPLRAQRLTADWVPDIDRALYEQALEGGVATGLESVEGVEAKKGYGVGVVDVPIGALWAAINDDAGKLARTRLSYAEILAGKPCTTPRTVFQYLPTPFIVSDRWWVSDFDTNHALWEATGGRVRELRWQTQGERRPTEGEAATWAEKGVPVGWTKGGWFLVDLDGKSTLVEYATWADPGGSLPAGPVSSFSAGGIEDTVSTVASLAKDGPACPIE